MIKRTSYSLMMLLYWPLLSAMASKKSRLSIADNQPPQYYLNLGNSFLCNEDDREPDIVLAVEAFKKGAQQEIDLEVRAKAAFYVGKIYYFGIGGFSDSKTMEQYLSISSLAACQLPDQKELIRMAQILRQPKPFDLQQINRRGESPLHYASKKGYKEMLELLFLLGAQAIIEKEVYGQTALFLACSHGRVEVIEYLFVQGAASDTRNALGASLLHAAVSGNQKKVLKLLLKLGLTVSSHCDNFGCTAFYCAVRIGRLDHAALMLSAPEYNAYVDEKDLAGRTCLHWAALDGAVQTASYLVKNGAAINALTAAGDTPLHYAACTGNITMIECLILLGADRTIQNNENKIPAECSEVPIAMLNPRYAFHEELSPSI